MNNVLNLVRIYLGLAAFQLAQVWVWHPLLCSGPAAMPTGPESRISLRVAIHVQAPSYHHYHYTRSPQRSQPCLPQAALCSISHAVAPRPRPRVMPYVLSFRGGVCGLKSQDLFIKTAKAGLILAHAPPPSPRTRSPTPPFLLRLNFAPPPTCREPRSKAPLCLCLPLPIANRFSIT